jgi:hypothetical protein
MSILERLLKKVPKRKPLGGLSPQRQLVKLYMADIAEAKERGYSWNQINEAVEMDAAEKGQWDTAWNRWRIEALYREIRKEEEVAL